MRFLAVLVALALAVTLAGCFADVEPIYVPERAVPGGWSHTTDNDTQEAAGGSVDIVLNQYTREEGTQGEVYLIAVTDVPFVDEHEEIDKQIAAQARAAGVELERVGSIDITLDNGKKTRGSEYTLQKQVPGGSVEGKAWSLHWDASGFSAGAFGWATTETSSLLGGRADESTWNDVQSMIRAAEW